MSSREHVYRSERFFLFIHVRYITVRKGYLSIVARRWLDAARYAQVTEPLSLLNRVTDQSFTYMMFSRNRFLAAQTLCDALPDIVRVSILWETDLSLVLPKQKRTSLAWSDLIANQCHSTCHQWTSSWERIWRISPSSNDKPASLAGINLSLAGS